MFQAQNRETINSTWEVAVSFKIIGDDERDKTLFHNTTPDLQDQDQDQDRYFWSQTGLVLRPTVSNHITGNLASFSNKQQAGHFYAGSWHATSIRHIDFNSMRIFLKNLDLTDVVDRFSVF